MNSALQCSNVKTLSSPPAEESITKQIDHQLDKPRFLLRAGANKCCTATRCAPTVIWAKTGTRTTNCCFGDVARALYIAIKDWYWKWHSHCRARGECENAEYGKIDANDYPDDTGH